MRTLLVLLVCTAPWLASCGEEAKPQAQAPKTAQAPDVDLEPPAILEARTLDLDGLEAGPLPDTWTVAEGMWKVTDSPDLGPRIFQDAQHENHVFNVILAPETFRARDVRIQVTVDAVTGDLDQGGGPVWRARDAANYYIARWNPLEDNLRVYKVVEGVRTELAGIDMKVTAAPHVLSIEMRGDLIRAGLDGTSSVEVQDATFGEPGRIGLWTKSDARTGFSGLEVSSLDPR